MEAWGLTDPGKVRSQNQDYYDLRQLDDDTMLAVVCDGMGGARAGNIASRLAVEVFYQEIERMMDPRFGEKELLHMLKEATALSNLAVYDQSLLSEEYVGMGTTLVAALIRKDCAYVVNVGDSRAYHMNREEIRMITEDHSVVEMMVKRGEITREQAKNHPVKNLITRAVGTEETVESDTFVQPLKPGDSILLCSDGLSNYVEANEMKSVLMGGGQWQEKIAELMGRALERGGADNITVLVVVLDGGAV